MAVTCTPPSDSKVFENPIFIVEVLPPSNENETRESNSALAGLLSLKEILVVQSTLVEAEIYKRDATDTWPNEPVITRAGGTIRLTSIDLDLPMSEVYEGTLLELTA